MIKLRFTLIEITVAVAILSMGLLTAMNMVSSGRERIIKTKNEWLYQHLISQAAEYYLLAGHETSIPKEIFPSEKYYTTCTLVESNLPDGIENKYNKMIFVTYKIDLKNSQNEILLSLHIDKILKEEL